jgi:hypothetical protein
VDLATMARPKHQNLVSTTTAVCSPSLHRPGGGNHSGERLGEAYHVHRSPVCISLSFFLFPFSAYSVHELEKRHNAVGILGVRVESMDESTWLGRKTATRGSREPMEGREGKGRRGKAPPPSSVCRAWLWLWTLSPGAVRGRRSGGSDGG